LPPRHDLATIVCFLRQVSYVKNLEYLLIHLI